MEYTKSCLHKKIYYCEFVTINGNKTKKIHKIYLLKSCYHKSEIMKRNNNYVTIIGKRFYFQQKDKLLKIRKNWKKRTKKNSPKKTESIQQI